MSCPKCRGFVGCDCGEARCFNCGWRPGDGRRRIGTVREVGLQKCINCPRMTERTKTCAHCRASAARWRASRRQVPA